ncbi:MAG: hypothetical protein Q9166_006259 [cf. Caloplaca sp. 2 TL-2023]
MVHCANHCRGYMVWEGLQARVIPGGMIPPPRISPVLLLDVSIRPRMSFYVNGEKTGSFIVDAKVSGPLYTNVHDPSKSLKASHIHGTPWDITSPASNNQTELRARAIQVAGDDNEEGLAVKVIHKDSSTIISPPATIKFNETSKEFSFSLTDFFKTTQAPQTVTLELARTSGQKFTATTDLYYLPNPRPPQSVARIDSLYGGLQVRYNSPRWETIFPYSFYLSGVWLGQDPGNVKKFKDMGFNILHVVPGGGGMGYNFDELDKWFDEAEELGLWIMYDMRHSYQNVEYVKSQVERYKMRKNMLLWYTADEPDGFEHPPSSTSKAYSLIRSLDPYHPISLCLNCQNYYFREYSAGADIILADVYPIGANTSFSNKYHTPCNLTHGDCGCDNCHTSPTSPALLNIPSRLDLWTQFQTQLAAMGGSGAGGSGMSGSGVSRSKPLWSVPQAFTQQDFWLRTPTSAEVVAMVLLSVNHGAKGIVMWQFPTAGEIVGVASEFSRRVVNAGEGFVKFVLGAEREMVRVSGDGAGVGFVDAAMWRAGGQVMVSVVNAGEERVEGDVRLDLGERLQIKEAGRNLWGRGGWSDQGRRTLVRSGMEGVESFVFLVEVEEDGWGVATS